MLIFDLDGTLIHLPTDYDAVARNLARIFKTDAKFSPMIPTILAMAGTDGAKIREASDAICEHEMKAISEMTLVRGAKSTVGRLRDDGFGICMVTMQCRDVALAILDRTGMSHLFSDIVTRDESMDRLGQINRMLAVTAMKQEHVLVIGDTAHDMDCAKKAGCEGWQVGSAHDGSLKKLYDALHRNGVAGST